MKIIIISHRYGKILSLHLNQWAKVLFSLCLLGLPVGISVVLGLQYSRDHGLSIQDSVAQLERELALQRDGLGKVEGDAGRHVEALTLKLAEMQARLVRLDALGERITGMAGLDDGEFDFSSAPAVGGPEEVSDEQVRDTTLDRLLADLQALLDNREMQLELLKDMMADRKLTRDVAVAGLPITKGWMSSGYGMRNDPFNGRKAWHKGVDFAGKMGAEVVAVGAGIVIRSEPHKGYGNLIEIDHGDGLITRYGHNKANLAAPGELVKKGQVIALMGSSGRSTGPHVHFEVYKNGRVVDPASYIHRTIL